MKKSTTTLDFFKRININNSKANTNDQWQSLVLISQFQKILKRNFEKSKLIKLISVLW